MAIHTFICVVCGEATEKLVRKMDDNPPCPKCGNKTKQTLSVPSTFQWGHGVKWN